MYDIVTTYMINLSSKRMSINIKLFVMILKMYAIFVTVQSWKMMGIHDDTFFIL